MNERIQATLASLPHKPGIYLMKDAAGKILYVGKATSLHSRVRSYFASSADLSPKNQSMVAKIEDIEYIVVGSEVEALILECNYIKQFRPKYNVLLKDDKHYPYIKVALTESFPRVYRVRSFKNDGNRYFGPYTNAGAVDSTLDLLNKLFAYRTCSYEASSWAPPKGDEPSAGWKQKLLPRPCTQYYIHRCIAPCVANATREEYDEVIRKVILFLEGKHEEVIKDLEKEMEQAAEDLQFEKAAALRDRINAVQKVLEKQKIINTTGAGDQDVIALASSDDETCALVFFFRSGKLVGREYFILQGTRETTPHEIMASFLEQFYDSAPHIPGEILLQYEPNDVGTLTSWLKNKREGAVNIQMPKRGDKLRLIEMVAQNATEVLEQQRIKWLSDSQKTAYALAELQEALQLPEPPQRIECYDISNIQGTSSVASMVVFEGGKPKTSEYRKFRIKTVEGANDFASHQEVLRRRFKRAQDVLESQSSQEENEGEEGENTSGDMSWAKLPDLIIIDGGKGQLSAGMEVLNEMNVQIPTVGLAKENEEIFVPGDPRPIILPRTSQGLYLVQRIRDEAHRFAITYHRQLRSNRTFKSILDDIPGIGPKRKKILLKHFGSVRAIAQASVEDLAALEGMNSEVAAKVKEQVGNE